MTTTRMPSHRRLSRSARAAVVALVAGAGLALTPSVAAAGPVPTVVPASVPAYSAATPAAQIAVNTALAQVGKPYAWGGAGPRSYDCSGLMQYAYAAAGVGLPHSSRMQSTMGTPVWPWDLKPGDLIFFYRPVSHVAMYIGDGLMVHASTSGKPVSVVRAASMPGYAGSSRIV